MTKALPRDIQKAEFDFQTLNIRAADGVEPSDVKRPSFWELVSDKLNETDEIRVIANDMTWVMRLVVVFKKASFVHVAVESFTKLVAETEESASASAERYRVESWYKKEMGHKKWKWVVVDTKAATVEQMAVEYGFASKEDAQGALDTFLGLKDEEAEQDKEPEAA